MQYLKGDKIFDGQAFLPPASVLVFDEKNLFRGIVGESSIDSASIRRFEGILCPGFVNAHCHLELSHLKGRIPEHTGLPAFGRQVIGLRDKFSKEVVNEKMAEADRAMYSAGIAAVGDISNAAASIGTKVASRITYHTFVELLAFNPAAKEAAYAQGLSIREEYSRASLRSSLAPHAPYSVSAELMQMIGAFDEAADLPFSMHNQESPHEDDFFRGNESGFYALYEALNMDISFFKPPGTSSLQHCAPYLPEGRSMLVHNTLTTAADLAAVKEKNIYWCFCPSANLYIENRLPDLSLFEAHPDRICLGTDSLASNDRLDLVKEGNHLLHAGPFKTEQVLAFMCRNGAEALGLSAMAGSFISGKDTGLNHLLEKDKQLHFQQRIF